MPIQAPQWTDYLNCPVCCREFGAPPRSPISLGCGHTVCRHCLKHLHRKQCPFDQTVIQVEPEELVVNTALLQLAGYTPPPQPYHPPCIQALPERDRQAYDVIVRCMEHLAVYLKYCGNANNSMAGSRLSRPMQRKLVTLLQCAITDEEGRGRAARAARSLGERTVTELILQHQNPQQLSANLWAAVRARGCQFLGPAMQEEVLKLVLLALEDGSALSRKVLVMFVVQRLEPHFPQASKTSIGHVVQLLYRASCFKVSKRECDSSLMQLKDEFRTYESLRREHDAQIVQIATEAGLRIAPDQWSALLYGDTAHKSHMQSIIDKLQTPQSFAQSVQELFIALQRTGDSAQLVVMSMHLDRLASIDASPDAKSPSWQQSAEVMTSLKEVVSGLIHYLQQQATGRDSNHNQKHSAPDRCSEPSISQPSPQTAASTPTHSKYKVSMCRDAAARSFCPRGNACTFAHSEEELERFRGIPNMNGNYQGTYGQSMPPLVQVPVNIPPGLSLPPQPIYQQGFPVPPQNHNPHLDSINYNNPPIQPLPIQGPPQDYSLDSTHHIEGVQPNNYPMIQGQGPMLPVDQQFYRRYRSVVSIQETLQTNVQYQMPIYTAPIVHGNAANTPAFQCPDQKITQAVTNIYIGSQQNPSTNISPYPFDNPAPTDLLPDYHNISHPVQGEIVPDPASAPTNNAFNFCGNIPNDTIHYPTRDVFNFDAMRNALLDITAAPNPLLDITAAPNALLDITVASNAITHITPPTDEAARYNVAGDRRAVGADRPTIVERHGVVNDRSGVVPDRHVANTELSNRADDEKLEEELQALERRFDTEYENAD